MELQKGELGMVEDASGHMLPDKNQEDFQVFLRWKERI